MSTSARPMPTLREELWRYLLCLLFSVATLLTAFASGFHRSPGWLQLDLALGVAAFVIVHWRRRWPMAVAVSLNLLLVVSAFASGPAMLALVSVATRRRWLEIAVLGVLVVGAALGYDLVQPDVGATWWATVIMAVVFFSAVVAWGMYVGSRRDLMWSLVARAESAEAEQAAQSARARADERTAIAREMHDVLAHRLSMATLHAGGLAYRQDLDPEEVRQSAEIIRDSTHQALVDLRGTLSVLRTDGGQAEGTQTLDPDLRALIEESRAGGMRVADHICADLEQLPLALGRTVYRVVQELLTNARKHAPGTAVELRIEGSPGEDLRLSVRNPDPVGEPAQVPPSGFGLVGVGERVRISGGSFSHGRQDDGHYLAQASIPWPV